MVLSLHVCWRWLMWHTNSISNINNNIINNKGFHHNFLAWKRIMTVQIFIILYNFVSQLIKAYTYLLKIREVCSFTLFEVKQKQSLTYHP